MTTILFIIPSLDYSGLARRLTLLATHLPRDRYQLQIAVLGKPSVQGVTLRAAGIAVNELGLCRPFDVQPYFALRRLSASLQPEVIHTWGDAGLRATLLAGIGRSCRLFVSGVLPPTYQPGWFRRLLLRRAEKVIAFGKTEADRYRRLGVPDARLTIAPLATASDLFSLDPGVEQPTDGRMLLGVGPIERHKGFHDAVWAFDILQFLYDDLKLVLAGDGADRLRVEEFAKGTTGNQRIHCTGLLADLAPLRRQAVLSWVLGRAGGVQAALEATAAGLPVVASRTPELAEVVVHGETGLLVAPGDKADLARQTRVLLDDVEQRRAFGEAGRRRAAKQFAPGPMVDACISAYCR